MSLKTERDQIIQFKDSYTDYLRLRKTSRTSPEQENQIQTLRSEINPATAIVISYINKVGEPTSIYYSPPPLAVGVAGNFDLLQNLFNPALQGRHVEQSVFVMLDRGIGRYDHIIKNQWKKWVNPFHWFGEIIRLPFYLLRFSGFDSNKIELSLLGKIYKLIAAFVAFVAGLVKIYQFAKPIIQTWGVNLP